MPASLYRLLDDLSENYGNHTLRATTRSAFQMHGILKGDLKTVFAKIMNAGGSTIGACGDINRNVVATPAQFTSKPYELVRHYAREISEVFAPQSGAFAEVWLDGEKAGTFPYAYQTRATTTHRVDFFSPPLVLTLVSFDTNSRFGVLEERSRYEQGA